MRRCMKIAAVVLVCVSGTRAGVVIESVPVGNPGNAGELSGSGAGGPGPTAVVGGVGYTYHIGKYEVTAGQYTEFLNAVADDDTYGLYNGDMWSRSDGCKIQQSGSSGSYTYSVTPNRADRPVNYVNWYDTLRFANWAHNGQPAGAQDPSTTEDGAYDMSLGSSVVRKPGALVFLPSEDEWYKAAYHKNDGVTGNYFDYPTSSDAIPSNDLVEPTDPGNNATFWVYPYDYTIGSAPWRTEVGEHENSESPYGTFDQGGNEWEWNETAIGNARGVRGGSFDYDAYHLHAASRHFNYPANEHAIGFRVAQVPEATAPALDIKPGSCPNSVNRKSRGVLPVALLGTDDFEVMDVDLSSLVLMRADGVGGGVSPHEGPPGPHSTFEDLATPFEGEACDCHDWAGDGIDDLSMKFKTQTLVEALQLNDLSGAETVELVVSGALLDGTPFTASDCIRLVPARPGRRGR